MNITQFQVRLPIHFPIMVNPSPTKGRRRLFADSPQLCNAKLEHQKQCILKTENERFENKYNFDCSANKPLKDGQWDWQIVDSRDVPAFYTQPYIAKNPESLKNHHMACVKNWDRNRIYRNVHFQSLATLETPYVDTEQTTTTTTTSNIHPVLPETPLKGVTHPSNSSFCGTKRKLSQVDAESDFSERNSYDNSISSPNTSSSLHSHSSSETLLPTESSSQFQDSVGNNLQNTPCTSTTDNNQSSSQTRQNSLHVQQEKQLRQTNLKGEFKFFVFFYLATHCSFYYIIIIFFLFLLISSIWRKGQIRIIWISFFFVCLFDYN